MSEQQNYTMLRGLPANAETIRQGSVVMEHHPEFEKKLNWVARQGFSVKYGAPQPNVQLEAYLHQAGHRTDERVLYLATGMSFIDLEHELDHIQQVLERFIATGTLYLTELWEETPRAEWQTNPAHPQVLKTWQVTIIEYHTRLVELERLVERQVSKPILLAHAKDVHRWSQQYWSKGRGLGKSHHKASWEQQFFPDLVALRHQSAHIFKENNFDFSQPKWW